MAKTIGRYEIRAELGRGGMAAVYRAHDPKLDREIALKLMDQQLSTDPTFVARFEREAKTVAGLEHSAIVSLYDYGEADGWLYLVMRYMKGGSLKELIARGPLTTRQAYGVVRRIGAALDKAQSNGVVHRDLKPGNVLLDAEGEAYLSDFGIVKVAKGDSEYLTDTGQTLGTFAYMSPEQVMGQELDGRSDIYALGLILYEMMTGKHPYGDTATSSGAMAVAHTQQPVPDITEANPAAPAALNEIVQKATAKNRDERYATGREMTLAMYEALTRKPEAAVAAAPEGPGEMPQTEIEEAAPQQADTRQPAAAPAPQQPEPPQPSPAPGTGRPPATPSAQPPARQVETGQKRKAPVWVFALAGVAIIAVIGIAVVVIGSIGVGDPLGIHVDPESNTNGTDSQGGGVDEEDSNDNTEGEDAQTVFITARDLLQSGGDPAEALELLNQAIDLNPNVAEYYALRADLKTTVSGDYENAITDMDKAIELDPTESSYYGTRGNMRSEIGDYDLAEADFLRAIELQPRVPWFYQGLGWVYYRMGDRDKAIENYVEAINLEPQVAENYTSFSATLYFEGLGGAEEAIEVLTTCINEARDRVYWCYWERGWIYDKEGRKEEAAADLQAFTDGAPAGECDECLADAQRYLAGATGASACPASADGQLTVWIDESHASTMRDLAGDFEAICGTELVVEERSMYETNTDVSAAAAAGGGPDLFFGIHETSGSLIDSGLLAPIDLGAKSGEFVPAGLDAFTTGGNLYGMPVLVESIALYRNTDMAPSTPQSWDEVLDLGGELQRSGRARYAIALPNIAYYAYPIVTNFGGYVFGRAADGTWDTGDLGIDGRGMMSGVRWILAKVDEGLAAWVDYDEAHMMFMSGEAPFLLTGPWAHAEIQESGVPYAISEVPGRSQPFLGAFGFMVNAAQPDTELAQYFLTDFVANEAVMTEFARTVRLPSAYSSVLRAIDDPDLVAMGQAAVNGTPTPSVPEMRDIWGPWDQAFSLAVSGELTVQEAFSAAADQIRSNLR